jgi:single-stranded DNA-binding protein
MADYCKLTMIGRLAKDPVRKADGQVEFQIVYTPTATDSRTGDVDDAPVYIDAVAFDRPGGRQLGSFCLSMRKGNENLFEGRLAQKRILHGGTNTEVKKLYLMVDNVQYLHQRVKPLENRDG